MFIKINLLKRSAHRKIRCTQIFCLLGQFTKRVLPKFVNLRGTFCTINIHTQWRCGLFLLRCRSYFKHHLYHRKIGSLKITRFSSHLYYLYQNVTLFLNFKYRPPASREAFASKGPLSRRHYTRVHCHVGFNYR